MIVDLIQDRHRMISTRAIKEGAVFWPNGTQISSDGRRLHINPEHLRKSASYMVLK